MKEDNFKHKPIYVYVNGQKIDERKVEVLNIEEDMQGRDLLTFKYKKKRYKSYRVS
jgi:hypothetical protein